MCPVGITPPFFADTSLIFLILVNVYGFLVIDDLLSSAIPLPSMTENPKRETILGLGIPDYVAVIFQCWRLKFMVLEVLLALYLSCRAFQLKRNWNVIFLKFQTTTRTILLSQLRRVLIDQIDSIEFRSMSAIREILDRNRCSNNCNRTTFKFDTHGRICTTFPWLTSHSISYLGSRINNGRIISS